MKVTLINNEEASVQNVKILGRVPFENNKNISTKEDLGSTFTASMTNGITLDGISNENVKIYYSENEEATEDIANGQNAWTTNVEDFSKVKSYLIQLNNEEIKSKEVMDFKYNLDIPGNLEYDEKTYSTYKLFYTLNGSSLEEGYTSMSIATPEGPNVEVTMDVDAGNGSIVHEYDRLKYTITVKNTGDEDLNNVVVTAPIPEGTTEVEYQKQGNGYAYVRNEISSEKMYNFEKLEPEQEIKVSFMVDINSVDDTEKNDIVSKATVLTNSLKVESNIVSNSVKKSNVKMTLDFDQTLGINRLEGDDIAILLNIVNIDDKILNDNYVDFILPKELKYNNIKIYDKQNSEYVDINKDKLVIESETGRIRYNIEELGINEDIDLRISTTISNVIENKEITVKTKFKGKETDELSAIDINLYVEKPNISIELYSEKSEVKEEEEFEYYVKIINNGTADLNIANMSQVVSSNIIFKRIVQYIGEENSIGLVTYSNDVNINLPIEKFDLNQRSLFTGAVQDMDASGGTATFDAIAVAVQMLLDEKEKNPDAKLMLFVLSDGETNIGHSLDDLREILESVKIPVHTIGYNANIEALENISRINEATSINADSDDVIYKLGSLFNAEM